MRGIYLPYSREQSLDHICSTALTECPGLPYVGFISLSELKFGHCHWSVFLKAFRVTIRSEISPQALKRPAE